jgi:hypothetical protein
MATLILIMSKSESMNVGKLGVTPESSRHLSQVLGVILLELPLEIAQKVLLNRDLLLFCVIKGFRRENKGKVITWILRLKYGV